MAKPSETLKELRECIADHLVKERKLDVIQATDIARVAVSGIQERFRGDAIYISTGYAERVSERDWQIWEQFNGSNHAALARKFEITERAVYLVIERVRPLAISKVQGDLFAIE